MLILVRKVREEIYIGDDVKVVVTQIGENSVKIGIEAPKDVRIDRGEVRERRLKGQPAPARKGERPAEQVEVEVRVLTPTTTNESPVKTTKTNEQSGTFGRALGKALSAAQSEFTATPQGSGG